MTLPNARYIRCNRETGQWFGAPSSRGPWHPIPAPQTTPPWKQPMPTTEPKPTLSDRLALAFCALVNDSKPC